MGHNGNGDSNSTFWSYKICDYNMWDRVGEMNYAQTMLLADIIKNNRTIDMLSKSEKAIWDNINGRFAHSDINGKVIPDILVFENDVKQKIYEIIKIINCLKKN